MRRVRPAGDQGTSMMEVIVGMSIMSLFMAMFTGAVVMMTRTANKAQSVTQSANQLNQAFLKLDRLVRYASAISPPGQAGSATDWYVELRLTNTGTERCVQLRVDNTSTQLQQRGWSVSTAGVASTATSWLPMADGITNGTAAPGASDAPFVALTPRGSLHQQLTVNLTSAVPGISGTTSQNTVTFTALNSSVDSSADSSGTVCQQWGRP